MGKKSKRSNADTTGHLKLSVRLSQCMIVRNEEKNIERALSWAKGLAFEQIVVDTGSTDRTVELAEKLGARVYHFEWIDDFAAAKNYAMDRATGDWIAILDADEYMSREDANRLIALLKKIQKDPVLREEYDAITCPFIDLDDNGDTVSVGTHQRFFKNRPDLRFTGRIHEAVRIPKKQLNAGDLRIFHTGYTKTAYKDTDKTERNIKMLRAEHDKDPGNPDIMHYLANAVLSLGTDEARSEAEQMHLKALASSRRANTPVRQLAFDYLIPRYTADECNTGEEDKKNEAIRLCDQAIAENPDNLDYRYYRAVLNNKQGNYKAALDDLNECERALMSADKFIMTRLLMPSPLPLYYQLTVSAEGMGDEAAIVRNSATINTMLGEYKDRADILGQYIRAMSWYGAPDSEIYGKLADVYNINDVKDLMFIARSAKDSGAIEFSRSVMGMVRSFMENQHKI